jgi:general secretion pathway protein G
MTTGEEVLMRRRTTGFTLVELLVVIGILAVLAAILFPVFSRAREKGRSAACASNLKQLGMALAMYASDYDGYYPWGVDPADYYCPVIWDGFPQWQALIPTMYWLHLVVEPYVKNRQIWECASDGGYDVLEDTDLPLAAHPSSYAAFGTSYMWRTELTFSRAMPELLPDPVATNVLFDGHGKWHGGSGYNARRWNMLFGDGHVKSVGRRDFENAWATPVQ